MSHRRHVDRAPMITTLSEALADRGYETLTPVQEAVTDPDLQDKDLLVSAQTGSGKTVGFGLAIAPTLLGEADRLGPPAAPLALVIAPTRELALQVMRELGWLYAKAGARVVSCVGGMDMRDERRALERGAHIVVGTPGRLRDHIQRGSLEMDALRAVVLDEADEMLDLGFREDLEFMLGLAPEDRRTLLFSATVPPMIASLAGQFQRDAVRVTTLNPGTQHTDIAYQVLQVAHQDTESAIINMLRFHDAENAIVFANTRAAVARLTARFANRGFPVVSLSGELSQSERTHALQAMRDGRARVCVATDVAARGIDLPNLDLVIHAELPTNSEGLLHRSGRTGRAGRKGISALVITPKISRKADRLLKWAKVEAEWTVPPSAEDILRRDEERLVADAAWDGEMTPEQADFAARLLAERSPEEIAAACLRLYRANLCAPEELSPPDARAPREERAAFGPSGWVTLSVGRASGAEPRWLLPLLCRAGDLSKDDIGAIRVQDDTTAVELKEEALEPFLVRIGEDGALEDGITVRRHQGPPPEAPKRGPRPERGPKPQGKPHRGRDGDGPARPAKPRSDTPYAPRAEKAERSHAPRAEKAERPYKPRAERSEAAPKREPGVVTPYKPRGGDAGGPKPYKARAEGAGPAKPYKPRAEAAAAKPHKAPAAKRAAPEAGEGAAKPRKAKAVWKDKPGAQGKGKPRSGGDKPPFKGKGAPAKYGKPKGAKPRSDRG
ncbi:DEAD/DEAH box helicase [Pseudooceanicola nanhaiensis]|uniref:DEAD/DEAH box helicase n=1 Tax=Pseudooceanicola nanhaiensis TaxID=375761 RepID=UPI003512D8A0